MEGRKINSNLDNPIDNYILNLFDYIAPYLKNLNMTPNKLTTISLFLTIYGIYLISIQEYKLASFYIFVGYMFDSFDGNFARRYNIVSEFGDYYDHLSDIFKFIFILVMIYKSKTKKKVKIIFFSITFIFLIISQIHLGCQEKKYDKESFLSFLKFICPDSYNIEITRYFGTGTLYMVICLLIYNLGNLDELLTFFNK
jgi:phosphatidylglycerophosphate synthase